MSLIENRRAPNGPKPSHDGEALVTDGSTTSEERAEVAYGDEGESWETIAQRCIDDRADALEALATLQREADEARESLARWMLDNSFATGHGDTIFDLISELKFQLEEQKARTQRSADEMREALSELHELVRGECPRLLNEDSGGNGALTLRIEALLGEAAHV